MGAMELLTAEETAKQLGVSKRTILKWARERKIESVRISRKKILISRDALDDFLRNRTSTVESPSINHRGPGRMLAGPKKRGGDTASSRKSWRGLREEVTTWQ